MYMKQPHFKGCSCNISKNASNNIELINNNLFIKKCLPAIVMSIKFVKFEIICCCQLSYSSKKMFCASSRGEIYHVRCN